VSGELVVQLDSDATVETPGWLERMVAFFLSDERIGMVTGKVVFDWGEIHACGIEVVGPEGLHDRGAAVSEPVGKRTYHQRVLRRREGDCARCDSAAEVDGGIGCCMMYRLAVALEAGGYDPGFAPVWFDDLDLSLSIRRLGYKVFYLPEVRVVHWLGARTPRPAWRRAAGRLPAAARARLARVLRMDRPPPEHRARLEHHYAYWRRKWGFDMLNPDIEAVRERWGETEVCWRSNPEMRAAGERIVAAYEQRATA
jgi:GT2 family glycosyltransferase